MKVVLIQPITLRSAALSAGQEIDEDPITAAQLINAGHAEAVTVNAEKPAKSAAPKTANQE